MVFNRALGEVDLHGIYRGHYRQNHVVDTHDIAHSHVLHNNIDGSSIAGDKGSYRGVNDHLIGQIESLVGYWALDGDASDSSGNGLDGSVSNPEWVSGVYGLAIAFDGDDGLVVDVDKMRTVTIDHVTMAAWVKGESSGNDGTTFESSMGVIMNKEVTYGACSRILHES